MTEGAPSLTIGLSAEVARARMVARPGLEADLRRLAVGFQTSTQRTAGSIEVDLDDLLTHLEVLSSWPHTGADDVVWAGSGDDAVYGGEGPDELHGGTGDDTVRGGPGDDRLWAGPGHDVVHGGAGDDVLHALAADGAADTLDCGPGRDTARVLGSERATTTCRGCETVVVVVKPTADDAAAEADRDADAD